MTGADREVFLAGLAVAAHLDGLLCHAYCLMENHYHLLVETPRANLDDAMQRLNGTYAMRFNRHHERTGHVFQGRYGAKLITDDDYALTVVRYIAANPVQAGLCAVPEDWRWSSYAATAGLAPRPAFLTTTGAGLVRGPRRVPAVRRRRARTRPGSRIAQPWRDLVPTRDPQPIADGPPDARLFARRDRRRTSASIAARSCAPSAATTQRATLGSDPVVAQEVGVSMHLENTPATWA